MNLNELSYFLSNKEQIAAFFLVQTQIFLDNVTREILGKNGLRAANYGDLVALLKFQRVALAQNERITFVATDPNDFQVNEDKGFSLVPGIHAADGEMIIDGIKVDRYNDVKEVFPARTCIVAIKNS